MMQSLRCMVKIEYTEGHTLESPIFSGHILLYRKVANVLKDASKGNPSTNGGYLKPSEEPRDTVSS
jgi:hypothetical protein